jgi:hypothetical protein
MITEGYTMDLYCDCPECTKRFESGYCDHPAQVFHNSKQAATKEARERGWTITRDRMKCYAPGHKPVQKKKSE